MFTVHIDILLGDSVIHSKQSSGKEAEKFPLDFHWIIRSNPPIVCISNQNKMLWQTQTGETFAF